MEPLPTNKYLSKLRKKLLTLTKLGHLPLRSPQILIGIIPRIPPLSVASILYLGLVVVLMVFGDRS
ncbi:hypothetical protein [Scytonema hofmannii]|uniref:hypothetical protein n=1 Tax=Scytonema hofmannii TaxID=34078 RepID=UPI0011DF7BA5|nr:hypothetical protein [Scytonema hofmannii]